MIRVIRAIGGEGLRDNSTLFTEVGSRFHLSKGIEMDPNAPLLGRLWVQTPRLLRLGYSVLFWASFGGGESFPLHT